MASDIFARFSPRREASRSFYEGLRRGVESEHSSASDHSGVDKENLEGATHDYEPEDADEGSESGPRLIRDHSAMNQPVTTDNRREAPRPAQIRKPTIWTVADDEVDDDVPASLLVERHDAGPAQGTGSRRWQQTHGSQRGQGQHSEPAEFTSSQWRPSYNEQRPHSHGGEGPAMGRVASLGRGFIPGSARERALWRWVNVSNLDNFIRDVYHYYQGNGFWCILCERALHLVESTFFAVFLTFLCQCIDFARIPHSKSLPEVVIPQCTQRLSPIWNFGLWLYIFYFVWKSVQFTVDIRRLSHIRSFYIHLLDIPEQDMQTVSWQDVVARIMTLRDENPRTATNLTVTQRRWVGSQSKERLDAHDIANRLMRRDNYLIAMINKDILDMNLPLPFLRGQVFFSRTLEWYLHFSILDFVFNDMGQVNQEFLKAGRRGVLSTKLRHRFIFAGIINLVFSPFIVAYLVVVHFLTYYNEYQKDPKAMGARRYTPLAEWKFREFNELPHLFQERINMSYPFATCYNDQFPKKLTEQIARSVAFLAGAVTSVLALASVLDPELFLGFEVTKDRTALFYIGFFGTIWALARGSISEDISVFDPEYALKNVISYTHYMPAHWQGRLHSFDIKKEFSQLYKLKIVILAEEILGILTASLVLLLSAPGSSNQIIDFFREFTIHVDGLGYVCSFAVFDFKKGVGSSKDHAIPDVRKEYYSTKHGKMAASYYGFLDNYVLNPKTGVTNHLPPGLRPPIQPAPPYPPLYSPMPGLDIQNSRGIDRTRMPGFGVAHEQNRDRRQVFPAVQASPMTSVLLDSHHQPILSKDGKSSSRRYRPRRPGFRSGHEITEETATHPAGEPTDSQPLEDESLDGGGPLGESIWETSPAKLLSREDSMAESGDADGGVLGLIYQFQQAHRNDRPGGVL